MPGGLFAGRHFIKKLNPCDLGGQGAAPAQGQTALCAYLSAALVCDGRAPAGRLVEENDRPVRRGAKHGHKRGVDGCSDGKIFGHILQK